MPWIKAAAAGVGRLVVKQHVRDRLLLRHITMDDLLFAVRRAFRVEPYSEPPRHGGTSWRVHGKDDRGRTIAIGVEAYADETPTSGEAAGRRHQAPLRDEDRRAVVCTIFEIRGGRR